MARMVLLRCREAFGARAVCLDELNREPIIICIPLGVRAEQKWNTDFDLDGDYAARDLMFAIGGLGCARGFYDEGSDRTLQIPSGRRP